MGTALVVWRKHYIRPQKRKALRTICEVLRELHRDAEQRADALSMTRIDEAHDMAKRMQRKLEEYAPNAPYVVSGGVAERKK
jgi:hypothetical protein